MYPSPSFYQKLSLLAFLFSSTFFASIDCQCSTILERKEWRTLTDQVKTTYLQANLRLQTKRGQDGRIVYDSLSNMHNTLNPRIHGNAVFLPWHRWFLYQFEKLIQAESSASTFVPYWSTSLDSQALNLAPVFGTNDTSFGGLGDPRTGCVTTGPFRNWRPSFPNSHCLQRASAIQPIGAIPPVDILAKEIAESRDFQTLAFVAEGNIHAYVHIRIGSDMSTMFSPNDPLFYLHHANVDKVWWTWQRRSASNLRSYGGPNSQHVDARQNRIPANAQYELPGYPGVTVQQVLDTTSLCYTYKEITTDDLKPPPLPPPQTLTTTPTAPITTTTTTTTATSRTSSPTVTTTSTTSATRPTASPIPNPPPFPPGRRPHWWNDWFDRIFNRGRPQQPRLYRRNEDDEAFVEESSPEEKPNDGPEEDDLSADETLSDSPTSKNKPVDDEDEDDSASELIPPVDGPTADIPQTDASDSEVEAEGNPYKIIKLNERPTDIPADDMSNLLDLRYIDPLPERWIKLNRLNETRIREHEEDMRKTIAQLNKLDGYVSTCALWNRPDMLVKLVQQKRVDKFYAVVNNTKVEVDVTKNGSLQAVSDVIHRVTVALNGTVTKPIEQIAPKLQRLIGPPVFGKDCVLNPYSPRIHLPAYDAPPLPPSNDRNSRDNERNDRERRPNRSHDEEPRDERSENDKQPDREEEYPDNRSRQNDREQEDVKYGDEEDCEEDSEEGYKEEEEEEEEEEESEPEYDRKRDYDRIRGGHDGDKHNNRDRKDSYDY